MDIFRVLKNLKVVLVEDDPWILSGLKMYFRFHKCELSGYENGTLAMEALAKDGADVVICDYCLPDIDGLTLLGKVRDRHPGAICILMTAYPSDAIRVEAFLQGVHDFIPKPLTIQKLEDSLRPLIEKIPCTAGDGA